MCNKKHLEHKNYLFVGIHLSVKGALGFGSIFLEIKLNVYFSFYSVSERHTFKNQNWYLTE